MSLTRQLIFGIDPYRQEGYIQTLSFEDVPDANTSSKAFTCGLVPNSRSSGASLLQETMFLGTTSAVGKTYQALKDTLSLDGSMASTATWVSQRIDPEARADSRNVRMVTQKRWLSVTFNGESVLRDGVSIQYCLDGDPLSGDPITWRDFVGSEGDRKLYFDGARSHWIHIKVVDESTTFNEIVIPPFSVEYISDGTEREGRID